MKSRSCKSLSDLYSTTVWEKRLVQKFGPDWENLSKQLIGDQAEQFDLSDLYSNLMSQCQSKIKNCEVCNNWSIIKGDQDQENAHWAGLFDDSDP